MHKLFSFLLCLSLMLLALPLWGEAVQRVSVLEYIPDIETNGLNATKKPLNLVEVQVQGASSTITNKNGECVLRFNTLNVGDRIVVRRISRPGYELFYPQMLADLVIRRDSEPLVITMISQENLLNLTRHTEKMINAQMEKQRKQEISELDPAAADYARRREIIERKYNAKLDDVEQYIDRLVRIDFTNLSKNERDIAAAYQAGNFEEILEQFDRSNLIEKYRSVSDALHNVQSAHAKVDKARKDQEEHKNDIIQYLQYQITLLKMEGSVSSTKKAMELLEKMLEIEPFGHFQMKEYMQMSMQLKEYRYLDSLIRHHLQDPNLNKYYNCRYLSDLGAILYEQMRYDEVSSILNKVFTIRKDLYDGSIAESPLSIYHMLINNQMMGRICMLRGQKDLAISHFKQSFDYYLRLRQLDSSNKLYADVSYKRLYSVITNLCEMQEWTLADSILNVTSARVESLFAQGSVRERYIVAAYKKLKIHLLYNKGLREEALRQEMDLISELSRIYAMNQPLCEDLYQSVLRNVTKHQYNCGNYSQTIYFADQWFTILRSIHNHREQNQLDRRVELEMGSNYTEILTYYAHSLSCTGHPNRTEAVYCEVIDIMEQDKDLAMLYPLRLALSYARVAEIRLDRGELDSALSMASQALTLNPDEKIAQNVMARIKASKK